MYCPNCGKELPNTAVMCCNCRVKFNNIYNVNANNTNSNPRPGNYVDPRMNQPVQFGMPQQRSNKMMNQGFINRNVQPSRPVANNAVPNKGNGAGGASVISFIIVCLLLYGGYNYYQKNKTSDVASDVGATRTSYSDNDSSAKAENTYDYSYEEKEYNTEVATEAVTEEAIAAANVITASDTSNMVIGDICNDKGLYVGLAYVKRSSEHISDLGYNEDVTPGMEVIYAVYDIYNANNSVEDIDYSDFSGYADGTAVKDVETYFKYTMDGVISSPPRSVDINACKRIVVNYEVPEGWSEIKLYYGSNYIWTISSDEVSEEAYQKESLYDVDYKKQITEEGEKIYSGDYEIVYDGYEFFTNSTYFGDDQYIVFKYTVNNTSSTPLDYTLVGYDMRCYQNNYITDSASYTINEKFGDYINIYDVDEIQSGMSAKIYVAFELTSKSEGDNYNMIYDAGYSFMDNCLGEVFIEDGNVVEDTNDIEESE